MNEPFSPARAIWDNRHRFAEAKAEFDHVRDTLQSATGGPRDFVRQQWLQIASMVYDFKPDLIVELGRGYGNSTCAMAFAAKLLRPEPCRIVSLCLADSYRTVSRPYLQANLRDKSLLDPIEALEADILSFDFEPLIASAKRVFIFWDAHGFDVAQTILSGLMRQLQDRPHVAIIHDMADLDAFPAQFRGYERAGDFLTFGSAAPKYVLGSVGSQYDEGVALVDFASRNGMRLLSAESSYFGELSEDQVKELETLFGPDFSRYGFWYYFSLNQAQGPLSFPERPVAASANTAIPAAPEVHEAAGQAVPRGDDPGSQHKRRELIARALADGSAEEGRDWLPWLGVAAAGRKTWDGVSGSAGKAGYLCDGPYWTLKPGRYVMRVALRGDDPTPSGSEADIGAIDIANHVHEVASLRIEGRHLSDGEIMMPFVIAEAIDGRESKVEARVRSSGARAFTIISIRIEPAPPEPAVAAPAPVIPIPAAQEPPAPPLSPGKQFVVAVTPPILLRILRRLWRMARGGSPATAGKAPSVDANRLFD